MPHTEKKSSRARRVVAVHAIKELRKNRNPIGTEGQCRGAIGGLDELACDYERNHLRSDARAGI